MRDLNEARQSSRQLFNCDGVVLGEYSWDARRAGMRRRGGTGAFALIAIAKTAVRITQHGDRSVIADPCTAIFYNPGQSYDAEQLLNDRPEKTTYVVPDTDALRDCVREIDPAIDNDPLHPMRHSHGPLSARTFAALRSLSASLEDAANPVDAIAVHQAVIELTARIVFEAYHARSGRSMPTSRAMRHAERRRSESAIAAHEYLLRHFDESLGLEDVARAAGISRYHLCRLFRASTGRSIHQYLTELRLRASLEGVCDRSAPLAQVALGAGFNSQSHFTTAFSTRFGRTPAKFRSDIRRGRIPTPTLRELRLIPPSAQGHRPK